MPPDSIPAEFASLYEVERARVLRKRALAYCAIVVGFLLLKVPRSVLTALAATGDGARGAVVELVSDAAIMLLHVGAFGFLLGVKRSRETIVRAMSWVVAIACTIAILATPLTDNTIFIKDALTISETRAAFLQGLAALVAVFTIHFVATWLVTLSPREGLELILPILAVFTGVTLFITKTEPMLKLTLIGLAPLAGLPGFLWSWWLHRSFNERFMAKETSRRYADVKQELTDARSMHEALFPRPVTTGRVRVDYRYEPAREIGGDFLFIHPNAAPPTDASTAAPALGQLSVVLIDVTGHGVTAALAVNRLYSELERIFALTPDAPPGQVLATLNQFTGALLAPKGIYATALCLRVEPASADNGAAERVGAPPTPATPPTPAPAAVLRWASAGHPAALLLKPAGPSDLLDATAPILGMLDAPEFPSAERTIPLGAADTVLAYSDGAIELTRADGTLLGVEGLARIAERARSSGDLCAAIMKELEPLRADEGKRDDTLLVRVRLA